MFHKIAEKTITHACMKNYISEEQIGEYAYGLELLLTILLNDVTVVVIGFLMGMPIESIVFWLIYKILKKYTGGFHFNSSVLCYSSTCIMSPVVLLIIKYVPHVTIVYSALTVAGAVILLVLSPIPAIQKPLDEKEKKVFGTVARILVCMVMIAYGIFLYKFLYAAKIISLSIISVAIFAVMGKIKETIYIAKRDGNK